jgi:hypothetical protein
LGWLPALGIAGVIAVVLLIGDGLDGYFHDELYFIVSPVAYVLSLPDDRREHTMLVATSHREAAALDVCGPALGLPGSFGPHRGYPYFGGPPESAEDMIYAGADADRFRP